MFGVLDLTWKPSATSETPPPGKGPGIVRNDPYDHSIRVTAGWADLGAEVFQAQLRTARLSGTTTDAATADFTVENVQDGVDLLIVISLLPAVTTVLPAAWFWDCQQVDGSTILAGKGKTFDDVTRIA